MDWTLPLSHKCHFCNKPVGYPDEVTSKKGNHYHKQCIRYLRKQKHARMIADMEIAK